jgi:AAA+ ATPase superfamily predicted ATPase
MGVMMPIVSDKNSKRLHFITGQVVPSNLLINRTNEYDLFNHYLLNRNGNVLLVGKRRIGKTSLIHKVFDGLEKAKILCVYVDLRTYLNRSLDSFLRDMLLNICYRVADKVYNKTASQMLSMIGQEPDIHLNDFNTFLRIYELIRGEDIKRTRQRKAGTGVKFGVEAGVEQTEGMSGGLGELNSAEFISLIGEIKNVIFANKYEGIIVATDEANQFASSVSGEILQTYFDIFSTEKIQFIFVADPITLIENKSISNAFEYVIELKPFESRGDVFELIKRYSDGVKNAQQFTEEAISKIWKISNGHPYIIQMVCAASVEHASRSNTNNINGEIVDAAWLNELRRTPELASHIK